MADRTDRSVDVIGNLERAVSLPSFETLERLAKALNVPVEEFFDFEGGDDAASLDGNGGDSQRAELLATASEICRGLETQELELAVRMLRTISGS